MAIDIRTRRELVSVSSPDAVAQLTPADVLKEMLQNAASLTDIVILARAADGTVGFLTTFPDVAETNLFVDRVKGKMLEQYELSQVKPTPPGRA